MTKYTSLETSKKLYEATGWETNSMFIDDTPRYTSDYLLDKLPKKIHKAEIVHYLTLSAKYGDEFKANYISPSGYLYFFGEPEDDEPAEALALLALKLKKEGVL